MTEARTQVAVAKEQAVAAKEQVQFAWDAVETARDQLVAAQESVKIAADQLGSSRGVALGQLLLTIDEVLLVHYVDIHSRLHPRSPEDPWSVRYPPTPDEQVRIETYMGLFERVFVLIERDIIPQDLRADSTATASPNLARNEWVRMKKLREHADGWSDFLRLCDELDIDVPA